MLAIRLQRLGRKKYPVYRVAVQEAQRHPSSGRVVAYVGSYNPHTKQTSLNKEKVETYLKNGAQPSPRVVKLLEAEKISLPSWVKKRTTSQAKHIRHPEKLRKNAPESAEETPTDEGAQETTSADDTAKNVDQNEEKSSPEPSTSESSEQTDDENTANK
jgi:small subunit ribosomal protein S16